MDKKKFIQWIYPYAQQMDIDTIFIVAQAALESGWGNSAIGNNLFGITKGSSWKGKTQLVTTTEYFSIPNKTFTMPEKVISVAKVGDRYKYIVKRLFRDYETVTECLEDHTAILKKPQFADAWPYRHDRVQFTKRIVDNVGLKYATDPNYEEVMNAMFKSIMKTIDGMSSDEILKLNKKT